jgi:Ser/Thr protein kinase RdoA (MazF antagonist)
MDTLRAILCLGDAAYAERDFGQWQPETLEYKRLRGTDCPLPGHLQQLLIHTQAQAGSVFQAMHALPQVLCHRDYWTENILISDGNVLVIDWDCAGIGAIGEDIASLIADDTDPGSIGMLAQKLVPAYYRGLQETMALPPMREIPVREMILLKFGYRFFQQVLFAKAQAAKDSAILALEQIAAL